MENFVMAIGVASVGTSENLKSEKWRKIVWSQYIVIFNIENIIKYSQIINNIVKKNEIWSGGA